MPVLAAFAGALFILLVLFVTDLGLSVRERLIALSPELALAYLAGLVIAALAIIVLVVRLLRPPGGTSPARAGGTVIGESALRERTARAREAGADTRAVEDELAELDRRRALPALHLVVFGRVSTGKSSLVRALIPGAEPEISARTGTTTALTCYQWRFGDGPDLVITDMPGTGEPDMEGGGDARGVLATEEAQRAHGVLYLAEGDLSREQWRGVDFLASLGKPLIVVLNKSDMWSRDDRHLIGERVRGRLRESGHGDTPVVFASAGGRQEIVRVDASGTEHVLERERPADLREVRAALRGMLATLSPDDGGGDAFLALIASRLDEAERSHRQTEGDRIVRGSTRKAVFGALAAVSPGTDVLVQGYLGYDMVRGLCALYGVQVRRIEITRLLEQAHEQTRTRLPLVLAIAGNALKAFPGLGTLVGGVTHAIAYGLIFDTLGRAVARTLEEQGRFSIEPTLQRFEVDLDDDLEARATTVAAVARDVLKERGERLAGPDRPGS